MIVAIHQPNFFPYEGVLHKIRRSDLFVILAHVQFSRGGYQNRFSLGDRWYTMSVNQRLELITKKHYCQPDEDWSRIKRQIPQHAATLSLFDGMIGTSLVETNVGILREMCRLLGIQTPIVFDEATTIWGTDRLVEICKRHGATRYLSGLTGPAYLELEKLMDSGISLVVQQAQCWRAGILVIEDALHANSRAV